MKVVLVNLSNEIFEQSRIRLNISAQKHGISTVLSHDFEELKGTSFYLQNKKILDQPTGMGYWAWKPYIILEAIKSLDEGDIVIYADAGLEITASLDPLIKISKEDTPVLLFANGNLVNAHWTKRDCFIEMGCDQWKYWYGPQVDAAFAVFRKSKESILFLEEWLHYCTNERVITDLPNQHNKKNLPGFIQHRRDQSVLSLLAIKHAIALYRMPTQFGNHYKSPDFRVSGEFNCKSQFQQKQATDYATHFFSNSPYFQLLDHHRSKKKEAVPKANSGASPLNRVVRIFTKRWNKLAGWIHKNVTRK